MISGVPQLDRCGRRLVARVLKSISVAVVFSLTGCVGIPENITPVDDFKVERYLGQWYEIARLDHPFEKGLTRVTASYSLRSDGGLRVVNRGYSAEGKIWKEAVGKAYFVQGPHLGYLKVSFFGPFYGSYVVFELDRTQYQYALVCGPDKSYLWILARNPHMDRAVMERLIGKAAALGFDTGRLITVKHD